MRDSNYSFPLQNRVCVSITAQLYDRRALDTSAVLPLLNSLTHLTYLTSTSPRIREILTVDGGLERLLEILVESALPRPIPIQNDWWALKGPSTASILAPDQQNTLKHSLAFQCVVNIGIRGSEAIRTRVVQSGTLDVVAQIMEVWLKSQGMSIASGPLGSQAAVDRAALLGNNRSWAHHSTSASSARLAAAAALQAKEAQALKLKEERAADVVHAARRDRTGTTGGNGNGSGTNGNEAGTTTGQDQPQNVTQPDNVSRSGGNTSEPPGSRRGRAWWPASLLEEAERTLNANPSTLNPGRDGNNSNNIGFDTTTGQPRQAQEFPPRTREEEIAIVREHVFSVTRPEDRVTDEEVIDHALTAEQRRDIAMINTLVRLSGINRDTMWEAYANDMNGAATIQETVGLMGVDVRVLAAIYGYDYRIGDGSGNGNGNRNLASSAAGPSSLRRPTMAPYTTGTITPFSDGTNRTAAGPSSQTQRARTVFGFATPAGVSVEASSNRVQPPNSAQTVTPPFRPVYNLPHYRPDDDDHHRAMSIDPPPPPILSIAQQIGTRGSEEDVHMDMDEYIRPDTADTDELGMSRRGTITAETQRIALDRLTHGATSGEPTPRPPSAPLPVSGIPVPPRAHRGSSTSAIATISAPGTHLSNSEGLRENQLAQSLSSNASEISTEESDGNMNAGPSRSREPPRGGGGGHPLSFSPHTGIDSQERSALSTPVYTPPPTHTGLPVSERENTLAVEAVRQVSRPFTNAVLDPALQQESRPSSRAGTEDEESAADGEQPDAQTDRTIGIVGNQDDDDDAAVAALVQLGDNDVEAQAQAEVDLAMGAPPGAPGAALPTPRMAEMTPRQTLGHRPLPMTEPVGEGEDTTAATTDGVAPVMPPRGEPFVVIAAGAPRGFHDLNNLVSQIENSSTPTENTYNDDTILLCLQLLAYLSKYPHVRAAFHHPRRPMHPDVHLPDDAVLPERPALGSSTNIFSLVERFTFRPSPPDPDMTRLPKDIQYWAGVIMRNACRKDESHGGIRQCAHMSCGKWEQFPREFAKCRRCRKAKYCSKECQSKAWQEGHRFWCVSCVS